MALHKSTEIKFLYSGKDHERVQSLFNLQLALMASMGQTPYLLDKYVPQFLRWIGYVLIRLYSAFIVSQTFHTCILFTKTTLDMLQFGKLDETTDALTQAIINAFSCFSTCYWLWHSVTLREYLEFINRNYRHHSLPGLTFVSFYAVFKRAQRITTFWLFLTSAGVVLYGVAPLMQGSHTLPLKCWYPFDPLQPFVYTIIYFIQMFTQLNIGVTFGCGSALYVTLIILMLGQYDVLYCSLKNLEFCAKITAGEKLESLRNFQRNLPSFIDDEVNQYLLSKEEHTNLSCFKNKFQRRNFKNALNDAIIECVKLHRFILDCCVTLESLFHPYCLVKSLQITMQLCLLAFVGVQGEKSVVRVFNLFQYLTLTAVELILFTFFGELLRQHSTRAGDAIFRSEWFIYGPLVRKDILIFLINSQRAVTVTAGKFFVMDLQRLRSVVAQAFSFLTLLQKLASKNNNRQE